MYIQNAYVKGVKPYFSHFDHAFYGCSVFQQFCEVFFLLGLMFSPFILSSLVFPWFFFTFFSFFLSFLAFSSTPWLFYYCFHVVLFLSSIIPVYYAYNFATHFHALLAFWFHRLYSFHSVLDANNHISRTYTQTPRVEMGFFLAQPYNTTLMQIADKRFPPEMLITQKTTHTHSTCKAFHAYCTQLPTITSIERYTNELPCMRLETKHINHHDMKIKSAVKSSDELIIQKAKKCFLHNLNN